MRSATSDPLSCESMKRSKGEQRTARAVPTCACRFGGVENDLPGCLLELLKAIIHPPHHRHHKKSRGGPITPVRGELKAVYVTLRSAERPPLGPQTHAGQLNGTTKNKQNKTQGDFLRRRSCTKARPIRMSLRSRRLIDAESERRSHGPRLASPLLGTAAWCSCCLRRTDSPLATAEDDAISGAWQAASKWWRGRVRKTLVGVRTTRRGTGQSQFARHNHSRGWTSCFRSGCFFCTRIGVHFRFLCARRADSLCECTRLSEQKKNRRKRKRQRLWQSNETTLAEMWSWGEGEGASRQVRTGLRGTIKKSLCPPPPPPSLSLFIEWPGHFADSSPSEPRFRQRNNNSTERLATRSSSARKIEKDSLIETPS